ncbi:hypothetical protein J6590_021448 [Homalodisca vitripennis]|nr:hypothetical protein J6590_021448 [Homalodisca vitripennis]
MAVIADNHGPSPAYSRAPKTRHWPRQVDGLARPQVGHRVREPYNGIRLQHARPIDTATYSLFRQMGK